MTKPIHRFRVDYILKVNREREDRFLRRVVPTLPKSDLKAPSFGPGLKRTRFPG